LLAEPGAEADCPQVEMQAVLGVLAWTDLLEESRIEDLAAEPPD
jgi:hypothetical protein